MAKRRERCCAGVVPRDCTTAAAETKFAIDYAGSNSGTLELVRYHKEHFEHEY